MKIDTGQHKQLELIFLMPNLKHLEKIDKIPLFKSFSWERLKAFQELITRTGYSSYGKGEMHKKW